MSNKIGVVDVGGGYRGVYACGVLDWCLDNGVQFDMGIGVSAGSANLISYGAGQRGRNRIFYTEYGLRRQYASLGNYIRKGSYIDLDYVYSTLSNSDGENPLDYAAFAGNPMDFYVVATEAVSGRTRYFTKAEIHQDAYDALKASCAIPAVCRPYEVAGTLYFDGALGDPVPVQKAFDLGCDKVVLLLTLPADYERTAKKDLTLADRIEKKYPQAAHQLRKRAVMYNAEVELAKRYAQKGKLLIVAPDDTCGVHTLCRDAEAMNGLYEKGYRDGTAILDFVKA